MLDLNLVEKNIQQLQEIFEGVNEEANSLFKGLERELKIARIKDKLRENVAAQMIIHEIGEKLKVCNHILTRDRGLDRDAQADRTYRARVFERQDTLEWLLGLFGNENEVKSIAKEVEKTVQHNAEFLPE